MNMNRKFAIVALIVAVGMLSVFRIRPKKADLIFLNTGRL